MKFIKGLYEDFRDLSEFLKKSLILTSITKLINGFKSVDKWTFRLHIFFLFLHVFIYLLFPGEHVWIRGYFEPRNSWEKAMYKYIYNTYVDKEYFEENNDKIETNKKNNTGIDFWS